MIKGRSALYIASDLRGCEVDGDLLSVPLVSVIGVSRSRRPRKADE